MQIDSIITTNLLKERQFEWNWMWWKAASVLLCALKLWRLSLTLEMTPEKTTMWSFFRVVLFSPALHRGLYSSPWDSRDLRARSAFQTPSWWHKERLPSVSVGPRSNYLLSLSSPHGLYLPGPETCVCLCCVCSSLCWTCSATKKKHDEVHLYSCTDFEALVLCLSTLYFCSTAPLR